MSKKIKKIEDFGIPLDENIKGIIQRAYSQFNNKSAFADAVGIDRTTACFILGTRTRSAKYISWDKWPKLRDYLAAIGELDPDDPRWLTPDEMRGSPDAPQCPAPTPAAFRPVAAGEPSSSDFVSWLMSRDGLGAEEKVAIFREHEIFLSTFGRIRQDSAGFGRVAQYSTDAKNKNSSTV